MPAWTPKRAARVRRRADGTFRVWTGGDTKAQLKKKENNYHGIQTHVGQQFKAQTGRRAKVGDIHRTKNADGTYNEQAWWYIKTRHGWRKSPHGTKKPTAEQVRLVMAAARPGRKATSRRKRRRD